MKLFVLSLIIGTICTIDMAQTCDLSLTTIVLPSSDGSYNSQVESYLKNRMRYLLMQSSSIANLENSQFAMAADYYIVDKVVVSGTPSKIAYDVNLCLYILDLKNAQIFSNYSKRLKGIGSNETKALINTFQNLNLENTEVNSFVQTGSQRIIDYYNKNYEQIIASAKSMVIMKNYDAAIYSLLSIPECCVGYSIVLQNLKDIYQQFVNQHCNENLAQARSAWVASPDIDGASTASVFLSEIYPDAACYKDALLLYEDIKKKMGEIWKFEMKQWNDSMDLERQRLNAMRDIAMAHAQTQPQEINVFWK